MYITLGVNLQPRICCVTNLRTCSPNEHLSGSLGRYLTQTLSSRNVNNYDLRVISFFFKAFVATTNILCQSSAFNRPLRPRRQLVSG